MSVNALSWAMGQETGHPTAKLALIMMAEQSSSGGIHGGFWMGTPACLAADCDTDELGAIEALDTLIRLKMIEPVAEVDDDQMFFLGNEDSLYDRALIDERYAMVRSKIPKSIRLMVYARDGYRCVRCGSPDDLTLDHIKPWSLGGPDTEDNLQTMCRSCNCSKGARV